jgi:hypothetical protein
MDHARRLNVLVLHRGGASAATLSYQVGWPAAFARHPRFDATLVDVAARGAGRLRPLLRARRRAYEAIVVLHSVFSNEPALHGALRGVVRRHPAAKAFFVGNEYKLMPEKCAFAEELGVRLLVSQIENPKVHALYRERLGCAVTGIPGAGLEPHLFRPRTPLEQRPVDLGMRAYDEPPYFGHQDRHLVAAYFLAHEHRLGLTLDVSFDPARRFDREGWARFLDRCRGQLGAESGPDHFELTDELRRRVNAFVAEKPEASVEEVRARFFPPPEERISGRIITGRNIEAAGTKTAQLLFEGGYSGYLKPDVHYIPLRRDFANVDEAIAKLRDDAYCRDVTERAHELVHAELTYERLLDRFHGELTPLL